MNKWAVLELIADIGVAAFGVLSLVASVKRDEDLDERVVRLIKECTGEQKNS